VAPFDADDRSARIGFAAVNFLLLRHYPLFPANRKHRRRHSSLGEFEKAGFTICNRQEHADTGFVCDCGHATSQLISRGSIVAVQFSLTLFSTGWYSLVGGGAA
jgi:hypothetical protein